MLWFSSKSNKAQICIAIQEAWNLIDTMADIGAEQTGQGWNMAEYASHISDGAISADIVDEGMEQTAMGMSISENACLLEEKLKIIAKANGCKLARRPYN